MAGSSSSFEGTFSDENVDTSDGDDSSYEDRHVAPVSKSGLPFEEKVELFENRRPNDRFDDEESDSEYSSEESSSEGSSGSESYDDDQALFLKEQEQLRGMTGIPSTSRSRRWYIIGLAIFCVLLLCLGVGLGVGLTRKKDSDEDTSGDSSDSDPTPTTPNGGAPSNPPVRMPIMLPNPPKIGAEPLPETFNVRTPASAGITMNRNGESVNEEDGTVLVQGGDPENDELNNIFALLELPLDIDSVRFALNNDKRYASFCLDRVDEDIPSQTSTYSVCLIDPDSVPAGGVEALTEEGTNFLIPDDCAGTYSLNFDLTSDQSVTCVDVTDMLYTHYLTSLSGGRRGRRSLQGAEQDVAKPLVMMIDNLSASTEPGDRFVTANSYLDVEGEIISKCKTIADLVCSRKKWSLLCAQVKAAGLDGWLSDYGLSVTLFAPNDDAFLSVPGGSALTENVGNLLKILDSHLVLGEIQSSAIDCSQDELPPLRMINGELTTVKCDSGAISISGVGNGADALPKIIKPDLKACNGIIHTIDQVILPELPPPNVEDSDEEGAECLTVGEAVCSNEELGAMCSLYNLFKNDPLVGAIFGTADSQDTTLFLPSNEAAALLQSIPIGGNTQPIADLLSNHSVEGLLLANDLECDADVTMLGGDTTKTVCEGDDKFQVGEFNNGPKPKIIVSDILYCTGVVHIVDNVILTKALPAF